MEVITPKKQIISVAIKELNKLNALVFTSSAYTSGARKDIY